MGSGEKQKVNTMVKDQANRTQSFNTDTTQEAQDYRSMGQAQRQKLMPQLQSGWNDIYDTSQLNSMFGDKSPYASRSYVAPSYQQSSLFQPTNANYSNFAATGGIDQSAFDSARRGYSGFSATGGIDPGDEGNLSSIIGQLRDFGTTGGNIADISDADKARLRGGGVYDEFAQTGGLSDSDRSNIRTRATSVIPAAYQRASDEADRIRNVQGGYGPGASALKNQLLRTSNADAADASLNAELGITDRVSQGRLAGAAGMSGTEQALQSLGLQRSDLISRNKLAGMTGAGGLQSSLTGMRQQGKEFGVSGDAALNQAIQSMLQSGKEFGSRGLESLFGQDQSQLNLGAETTADAANKNVDRTDANDRYLYESGLGQKIAGLGGLSSLYNMGPSGMEQYGDTLQNKNMNDTAQNMLPYLQLLAQLNPSFMDRFGSILGASGSVAGGIGGIAGAFTGRRA